MNGTVSSAFKRMAKGNGYDDLTGIIQEMDELAANAVDKICSDTISVKEVNKHEEKQNDTDLTRQT